jgi:7,8-dihydroneopterin aldolase/epimerase/oxygenase
MDDTALAFEPPHARAAATEGRTLADRISVRDYTRSVEIGAFATERGVTQRVRFNVVLEVCHSAAAAEDDVDRVLSYDTITEAIEAEMAAERINLLETLAERVAARCLADPRALRVFVRVEKLDRIPGAVGIEIVRARSGDLPRIGPRVAAGQGPAAGPASPLVLLLAPGGGAGARQWLDRAASEARPLLAVPVPEVPQPPARSEALLRIGLLAMEQAAWAAAEAEPRFVVAASRTEIDWAIRTRRPAVWAPAKLVTDARPRPVADASTPQALARWFATEVGADRVLALGAGMPDAPEGP